jgi:hypothetical protein
MSTSVIVPRPERSAADDPYFDYCLWNYEPPTPGAGKLRSINLLLHSFEVAGADPRLAEVSRAIREGMGSFQTVWGVKQNSGGGLSWEYYFYDYQRLLRESSIPKLLDIIAPYIKCSLRYSEERLYFMFSIDLDDALVTGARDMAEVNVYMGNIGSSVSSGICYSLTEGGLELDNLYYFFNAKEEIDTIAEKIVNSAHLDLPKIDIDDILWPEMLDCPTIVVANKKNREGVYFSRIRVDQLIFFLKRMNYPEKLVSYVMGNQAALDHLLYDVGFDYVMEDGNIQILKSCYYGIF